MLIAAGVFQPGPLDAAAGWQPHRAELPLTVDGTPAGGWLLGLEFTAGHGPCPDLEIEVDGRHRGLFHPAVRREDRTEVYRHGPIAGEVTLDVWLPTDWLPPGDHLIAVTSTMDVPAATGPVPAARDEPRRHREQYGHHFGSGITWRAATLRPAPSDPAPSGSDAPVVELVATPLFVERDGGPHELLQLTVDTPAGAPRPRRATVRLAGHTHELDLTRDDRDFGQVRVRFAVPAFEPGTAEVSLDGGPARGVPLTPCRRWTLHLVPHVHLDVGYTDTQGKVLELHSRNLDRALSTLDEDPDFAFSVDGSLILDQYLATRSPQRAARLLAALRTGRLSTNVFHSLFLSGVASLEEVYRAGYLAARLRERHGVPVSYANLTDVPSYSAALPSMLAALGIEAFVGIENHHRGGNADSDEQHLKSPVRWEGVDGAQVLAFFSDTYSQLRFMAGDPQTVAGGAHALCRLLARYERDDYLPHDLPIIGTHADNEDLADGDAGFAARWNAAYAYPRIRVSTLADYLAAVRPLADRLPVWRGDGGSYWEDGVGTGATVTAEHRRVQAALPVAEALAALVSGVEPGYRPHRAALDAAWEGALFGCEHTWTWAHANAYPHGEQAGDQLDWKRHQVHTALRVATDETRRALSQLGELVTTAGPTLLVHNPLPGRRDVEVETELPAGATVPVPAEVLADCGGYRRYRLTVPDVPGFGYTTLPIASTATIAPGSEDGSSTVDSAGTGGWRPVPDRLETDRWEVTLDPGTGAVLGLTHRATGRELLDPAAPWRLGEVLYVLGGPVELTRGDAPAHSGQPHVHEPASRTTLLGRRPPAPRPDLTTHPAVMRPVGLLRTYDGWRLRAVGEAPSLPRVEVDVLLRDTSDRVDVTVRLDKTRVLAKESVYVAFPFAGDEPRFRYDRQQGWIDPAVDHAPGACQEWFTTQYGVVVDGTGGGPAIVWTAADAPLFTAGDIVRGAWPERFAPPRAAVLSWVLNNYWPTNTPPEQDGTLHLRYAFTPLPAFDPVAAARFGREVRAAPAVSQVTRLDKFDTAPRPLPASGASLVDLDLPDEIHATLATPRNRPGLMVRLQDLAGRSTTVHPRHPAGSGGAALLCTADERQLRALPVDGTGRVAIDLGAWQVATLILH
ncbi:glycoside hydrolase family 38 N-terminal domain-containing protein [Rugosimonospora acidiphila]|uniref:glycoside hydrolase family 38 N-terminal domain-containing protein n=1 Tax=Rugosimonospora acidiphila TaxID=556531 RepID=UPI0031E546C1